jgi:hypothetical protein
LMKSVEEWGKVVFKQVKKCEKPQVSGAISNASSESSNHIIKRDGG